MYLVLISPSKKKEKEFLRLEGDIVIFKDIPKLKIAEKGECEVEGELGGRGREKKKPEQTRRALCRNSVLPRCLIIANICGFSVSL